MNKQQKQEFYDWNPLADSPLDQEMRAKGWVYKDFRPMRAGFWVLLMDVIGLDNIHLITIALHHTETDGDYVRGQVYLLPDVQAKLQAAKDSGVFNNISSETSVLPPEHPHAKLIEEWKAMAEKEGKAVN